MTDDYVLMSLQEGSSDRPGFCLPWPYAYDPGFRLVIQHKRAGKVMRTEDFILVEYERDGERFRRWDSFS